MKKAVKTVSFMVAATMLSKILGLLRDMFIAGSYGTSDVASAFMSASNIPVSFFDLTLGVAVMSTFIPVFNKYLQAGDKKRALEFSNNFINIMTLISVMFCVLGMLFSRQLAHVFAPGFDAETSALTARLLVVLMPTTICTTLAYCFVGILQSFDEFNIPAVISLVSNLLVICYLLFFNRRFGIFGLAAAMLIGWGCQVLVQIPSLIKKGYRYRFTLDFRDEGVREALLLSVPILISSWVQPITVVVNKMFGSYMPGAVSALEYANRLYIIIVGVFAFGLTNYIFPALSRLSSARNTAEFAHVMKRSVRVMLLLIVPITVGVVLLAEELVTAIYGRGEFDAQSIRMTAAALRCYAIGMLAYGLNEIMNKCFYAMKNGKIPMLASVCGIVTTVAVSSVMTGVFHAGTGGLAFGAACAVIVVAVILIAAMNRRNRFVDGALARYAGKILLAAALMGAAVFGISSATLHLHLYIRLAAAVGGGAILYFALLWLWRVEELREVLK